MAKVGKKASAKVPKRVPGEEKTEKIYIVLSQTGSIVSKALKIITREPYNHSSIALTDDLHTMYSFGRVRPYNPFVGGFVEESPDKGALKRFKNTKILVMELNVSPSAREKVVARLEEMLQEQTRYRYNYRGLFFAGLRIRREKPYCYYCSEFVKSLAEQMELDGAEKLPPIVKPMQLLDLKHKTVYVGKLRDYSPPSHCPVAIGAV